MKTGSPGKTDEAVDSAPRRPRKPYAPPKLVSYGHVKDIIRGGGGMMSDAAGTPPGGNSKPCWIAETLYGVDDPRTLLLRAWLSVAYDERRSGWPLIAAYRRLGRTTAGWIRRGYLPRALFRRGFDAMLGKALDERARAIVASRR
jgi:hypothetical protein